MSMLWRLTHKLCLSTVSALFNHKAKSNHNCKADSGFQTQWWFTMGLSLASYPAHRAGQTSVWSGSALHLTTSTFKKIYIIYLFIWHREREREIASKRGNTSRGSGRGRSRLPEEQGARCGAQSQDWDQALSRRQTVNDWATQVPLHLTISDVQAVKDLGALWRSVQQSCQGQLPFSSGQT